MIQIHKNLLRELDWIKFKSVHIRFRVEGAVMKKSAKVILIICSVILIIICFFYLFQIKKVPTWQEQYDLGVRYLTEGNYQEAIIAFVAAIEIDAKRPEAYLKAAEAYEATGDSEAARAILERGYAATGDESLHQKNNNDAGSSSSSGRSSSVSIRGRHGNRLIDYDFLPETDKTTISTLIDLVLNEDEQGLYDLIETPEVQELNKQDYTIDGEPLNYINTYINVGNNRLHTSSSQFTSDGDLYFDLMIELREKDGKGYYVSLYSMRTVDPSQSDGGGGFIGILGHEYSYDTEWMEFQCSDWVPTSGEITRRTSERYKFARYDEETYQIIPDFNYKENYDICYARGIYTGGSVDTFEYEWRYNHNLFDDNDNEDDKIQTGTLSYDHNATDGLAVKFDEEHLAFDLQGSWLSSILWSADHWEF